ncbi:universal stress protein [Streptomyces sp. YC504]|uniref:Universal stress protein n=1 Tax=Streptomyces mesophilus TaxID=1775132 RepID=A0A6G4XQ70_9ACTN|nr:universal stress protein [Streptomyces mesophilus]NGO78854.1 universal stress protein [Streptomyces mesophilus]
MRRPVIVGVDGSARSRIAAAWAAGAARTLGAELHVVRVGRPVQDEAEQWPCLRVHAQDRVVRELAEQQPELKAVGVRLTGLVVPCLLEYAAQGALLVLGARGGGGFPGLGVGSTAWAAAGSSAGPVVLVPGGSAAEDVARVRAGAAPVVLGLDARRPAAAAADAAFSWAESLGAPLRILHAWQLPSPAAAWMPFSAPAKDRATWEVHEVQLLRDAVRPWREKYPDVHVIEDVVLHSPAKALVTASRAAQLLIVGRDGDLLGPVVDAVVHHTKCSLAVVPS